MKSGFTSLTVLLTLISSHTSAGPSKSTLLFARQAYQEGLYLQRSVGDLNQAIASFDLALESAIQVGADRLVESTLLRKAECFNLLGRPVDQQTTIAKLRSRNDARNAALGPARFFPPENEIIFQVDLRALLDAELLKSINIKGDIESEDLEKAKALLGIDLLEDLHRLTVGLSLAENKEIPVENWLVVMEGKLSGFKMNAVVKHQLENNPGAKIRVQSVHGIRVHFVKIPLPDSEGMQPMKAGLARLSDSTVLVGDSRSVRAFLAAWTGKATGLRANPKLSHVALKVPNGTTFWLAAVPERLMAKVKDLQHVPGLQNLPKLQGMLLTGRLDKDLTITGLAWAQDDQTAKMLGDVVRGLVALVQFVPVEDPLAKKLVKSLRVQTRHREVKVSATLSGALLAKKSADQKEDPGGRVDLRVKRGLMTIKTEKVMTVYIDGKKVGSTPMKRYKVKPGNHLLQLKTKAGKKILSVRLQDNKDVIIMKNLPGGHDINLEIPNKLTLPPLPPPPVLPHGLEPPPPPEPPEPPEPLEPLEPAEPAEPVGPY